MSRELYRHNILYATEDNRSSSLAMSQKLVTQKRGDDSSSHVTCYTVCYLSSQSKKRKKPTQPRSLPPSLLSFSLSLVYGLSIATSQPLADLADRGHAGTHAPHTATVTLCDCTRTTTHARMQTASHTRNNQATGESEWKYNDTGSVTLAIVWKPRKTENGRQEKDENFTVEFIKWVAITTERMLTLHKPRYQTWNEEEKWRKKKLLAISPH